MGTMLNVDWWPKAAWVAAALASVFAAHARCLRGAGKCCNIRNGCAACGLALNKPLRLAGLLGCVGGVAANVVAILATTSLRSIHSLCLGCARLRVGM